MVNVVFLHPDLGIGGAERLVVDAALALRSKGCKLPTSIFGYFHAVCAYIRMVYVALCLIFSGLEFDVVFCDQVSACIPVIRLARRKKKVLFYCHFPDQLLTARSSFLKRLYRAPVDRLEEANTGMADCVVVNSQFTAGVFKRTFESLSSVQTDVLYPSLNFSTFDTEPAELGGLIPTEKSFVFLSINRYERKKNCVLYTPSNEHFGIVPVEAMYMHCPVIAVNSGGPLESIADGETGFLCDPQPACFAEAMEKFVKDPGQRQGMGEAGRDRVLKRFSVDSFSERLYQYICKLTE
ncbi:ALG2 mannosyltransferase, partial [Polyodon spathula]|nr:ALG2 mannosyltransferase [Polyodon spathula]